MNKSEKFLFSLPEGEKMPLLFLGHGSPMNAIAENEFVRGFREIPSSFPRPSAILCISAHWLTRGTRLTAMEVPRTIHDFGGFPEELYKIKYPAKGSPELAKYSRELLKPESAEEDFSWGLDHGAWTVIRHLYPDADVPVVEMSIDYTRDTRYHFELASRLASLRNKGVLIIGSGNIIHNLSLADFRNMDKENYGFEWAKEARELINHKLSEGNFDSLMHYEKLGTPVKLAIPTPEHFIPLLSILGLKAKDEKISLFNDKFVGGSLSMTSLKIS